MSGAPDIGLNQGLGFTAESFFHSDVLKPSWTHHSTVLIVNGSSVDLGPQQVVLEHALVGLKATSRQRAFESRHALGRIDGAVGDEDEDEVHRTPVREEAGYRLNAGQA